MVSNPFGGGGENSIQVALEGDGSGLESALSGAEQNLMSFKGVVASAGAALGALAVGGLAESASAAADFEAAMADVEKVTSAETAEELSEPIQEMASELPLAAEQIANLSAQAGRFGAEGAEEIKAFTRTASEMGAATTLSADEAGRSLAKVATALDEPLENVDKLGDSINELSNNFATSSAEVVDAAQRGGFAISEMGLNSSEVLSLSAAMNEVAPSSRRAGNMLKQMGESIQNPDNVEAFAEATNMTAEEFKTLREESPREALLAVAEAMEDNENASQTLSESLSKQQVRAFQRASQQTDTFREAMETSNQAMEEGGSLSREVAVETDTLHGQWKLLQSEIKNVAREIGSNLTPILSDLLSDVSDAISQFSAFNKETDGMAGTVSLAAAAIGGLGATLLFFAGGPVTAAVAAIAGLGVAYQQNLGGIQEITEEVFAEVTDIYDDVAATLEDNEDAIESWSDKTTQSLKEVGRLVQGTFVRAFQFAFERVIEPIANRVAGALKRNFRPVLMELGETMVALSDHAETMAGIMTSIWERIDGIVVPIVDGLVEVIGIALGGAIDNISEALQLVMNLIQGDFSSAMDNLENIVQNTFEAAFDILGILKDGFTSVGSYLKNGGKTLLSNAADSAVEGVKSGFNYLTGTGDDSLIGDVKSAFGAVGSWIKDKWSIVDAIGEAFTGAGTAVANNFAAAFNAIVEDNIRIPEVTIGGGEIMGEDIPEVTLGGDKIDLPQLNTGAMIEEEGMYVGHPGERVLNPAETKQLEKLTKEGGAGTQEVDVSVNFDVPGEGPLAQFVRENAEMTIERKERRTHRNTGRNPSPR